MLFLVWLGLIVIWFEFMCVCVCKLTMAEDLESVLAKCIKDPGTLKNTIFYPIMLFYHVNFFVSDIRLQLRFKLKLYSEFFSLLS